MAWLEPVGTAVIQVNMNVQSDPWPKLWELAECFIVVAFLSTGA